MRSDGFRYAAPQPPYPFPTIIAMPGMPSEGSGQWIDSSATSLSAAALVRFVRPVTYQSLRDERLALQAATPGAFRRVNGLPQHRVDAMNPRWCIRVCINRSG